MKINKVIFAGLPNVGKSSVINAISKSNLKIGNWPGTTFEKKEIVAKINNEEFHYIDMPGTYSVESLRNDEAITFKYIMSSKVDLIVNVVDSGNLEKNLKLSTQLKMFGIKMIIVLNFEDEFKRFKFFIDKDKLAKIFECEVVFVSSTKMTGIQELKELIFKTVKSELNLDKNFLEKIFDKDIKEYAKEISKKILCKLEYSIFYIEGANIKEFYHSKNENYEYKREYFYKIKEARKLFIIKILKECKYSFEKEAQLKTTKQIDKILLNKYLAPIFALVILSFSFGISFSLANPLIDLIDGFFNFFISKYLLLFLTNIGTPQIIISFLIDGLLAAIGLTFSFMPLIFLLNFSLIFLQSTGYISRIAFSFEKLVSIFGISGRSIFPLLLGFGCNVPTVYALKSLKSENEQKLNLFIMGFVSCGARLPVFGIFALAFFPNNVFLAIIAMYITGLVFLILVGFLLKHKFKNQNYNIIEMPLYRFPSIKNIMKMSLHKTKSYINRIKLIVKVVLILWVLSSFPQHGENSIIGKTAKVVSPIFFPLGFGDRWEVIASLPAAIIAKEGAIISIQTFLQNNSKKEIETYDALADLKKLFTTFFTDISFNLSKDLFSFFKISKDDVEDTYGNDIVVEIGMLWNGKTASIKAISFMIFILLTIPCVVVLNAIKTSFSLKLMLQVAVSYFLISYLSSLIFYQLSTLFIK